MLIAKMLRNRNITDRKIYLFDTFEGMSTLASYDFDFIRKKAFLLLKKNECNKQESFLVFSRFVSTKSVARL